MHFGSYLGPALDEQWCHIDQTALGELKNKVDCEGDIVLQIQERLWWGLLFPSCNLTIFLYPGMKYHMGKQMDPPSGWRISGRWLQAGGTDSPRE